MRRQILFIMAAAAMTLLGTASRAQAWGAFHVGFTHVGYGGIEHYGHTSVYGPYGSYSGSHVGAYGAYGGSYHAGYSTGYHYGVGGVGYSDYHYATPTHYGAYPYGAYGAYRAGVYRAF